VHADGSETVHGKGAMSVHVSVETSYFSQLVVPPPHAKIVGGGGLGEGGGGLGEGGGGEGEGGGGEGEGGGGEGEGGGGEGGGGDGEGGGGDGEGGGGEGDGGGGEGEGGGGLGDGGGGLGDGGGGEGGGGEGEGGLGGVKGGDEGGTIPTNWRRLSKSAAVCSATLAASAAMASSSAVHEHDEGGVTEVATEVAPTLCSTEKAARYLSRGGTPISLVSAACFWRLSIVSVVVVEEEECSG